ncbi:hypothetical protein BJ322DRAFT_1059266 [Thelephora terrestris]|uniref:F-box domain-containing protein n=1 Tax=Thelephora terrestris TaxID=56493 RepID=A0A9P6HGB2_9AGAM|nr:hypothetical protein BJ322DRAFT_1059266 [Thelephora terrestris]
MHHCLSVEEVVRLITCELIDATEYETAAALARCKKSFENPVLDVLWESQCRLVPLLETFPGDIWSPGDESFRRLPTTQEWSHMRKYARRMRHLEEDAIVDVVSPQVLSVLQFRASSEPLFPNLQSFILCDTRGGLIPFIPLFLSPRTTAFTIFSYSGANLPRAVTASMIAALPTLCPNLQRIRLYHLPTDPIIAAAVSELLFTTNLKTLSDFHANFPLVEEAREVIYKLPGLRRFQTRISGPTTVPTMVLPNLVRLEIEYDCGHDWLQGFRGASLGKLASVWINTKSDSIGDFLKAFECVALTTSIPATLLTFRLHTVREWRPNYHHLLPFTQLETLVIHFSCKLGCPSTIDDDTIVHLARAIPNLTTLQFGLRPCRTAAGVTPKGLSALALYCLHLSELRIHFRAASFDPPTMPGFIPSDCTVPREVCALTNLDVGDIPIPDKFALMVALTLTRIFPCLKWIDYSDGRWREVAMAIGISNELADYSRQRAAL